MGWGDAFNKFKDLSKSDRAGLLAEKEKAGKTYEAIKAEFKDAEIGRIKQTCPTKGTECSNKLKCPVSDKEKEKIVQKIRESGKTKVTVLENGKETTYDIVEAITSGKINMYVYSEEVRKDRDNKQTTLAMRYGNDIWVMLPCDDDPCGYACAAADTTHEVTHYLDKSPNTTPDDKLRRETLAFTKQSEVWEALKTKYKLNNDIEDKVLNAVKGGNIGKLIENRYGIYMDRISPDLG